MVAVDIHRRRRGKWEEREKFLEKITYSAWVWRKSGLARDGTAESVSRDQNLRRERGQRKSILSCQLTTSSTIGNHIPIDVQSAQRDGHSTKKILYVNDGI